MAVKLKDFNGLGRSERRELLKTVKKAHRKKLFLQAVARFGTKKHAADYIGLPIKFVQQWMEDEEFQVLFQEAKDIYIDKIERKAFERAEAGKSDTMAIFLLKCNRPEVYGDKINLHHSGGISSINSPADLVSVAHEVKRLEGKVKAKRRTKD